MTNLHSGEPKAEPQPVYVPSDPQSARRLVDFHLHQLGLGDEWVRTWAGSKRHALPEGIGRCRATVLTEAAWPEGTAPCVLVDWYPDDPLRRNTHTGKVPPGAEAHWRDRLEATADALEALGYVVERNGPPQSPHTHWCAELLVYRMSPGVAPVRLPPGAREGKEPNPPHYQRTSWYPDPDPRQEIEDALWEAGVLGRQRYSFDPPAPPSFGRCFVRSITQTVWPPDAEVCAWVSWSPADEFKRPWESGVVASTADEHWKRQTEHIKEALEEAGYSVRWRARPWDVEVDGHADALVWRATQQGGIPR
ncbi:hypothetical protein [Streptomyces sp. NPDC093589]|uniref:hypothetical protein n=1 Tax=Streptomyces sp. NPDC093589 TaxID=3366043 RepID=UPI00380E5CCB